MMWLELRIEKHPDRDGLYLAVSPPHKDNPKATYGSKVWRYEFRWPAKHCSEMVREREGRKVEELDGQ